MNNNEKYEKAFIEALRIDDPVNIENLTYWGPGWDSVTHMILIAEIEKAFTISLNTDDVMFFTSFKKGKEILKKYEIEF